ncbi:ABC transporter substrate-binding protein [Wenxinia marina]|uniref:ABC-type dipeptide transport system, periplasmic component n=1 Tax=Wenxinia marina DSM 24838 TaxID=1123501 RepID=A0A0D0NIU8_9RHOB|nr:ABC transporter substrate-binding protein [Wenxinia marina]KIQ68225.1 ABC-type dipeptide transport system, periplasmic component [Wenxinia marina DSM 24838]GGL76858.1 peptide ABC transporter substrate-binding protein [Wenxinia marina]
MRNRERTGIQGLSRRSLLKSGAGLAGLMAAAPGALWAQETPQEGGTLRIAMTADIQPQAILAGRGGNDAFRHNVFDTLTVLDGESGQPKGMLATDWSSSEDGLTFTVQIRDDVTFHSGRPLTADDVVFTLEQMKVPENASQMRPLVEQWTSIEATGEHEVTITSDSPVAPRVFDVFQLAVIVDQETFAGLQDGSEIIGTGPFRFEEWVPGASVRMVANEDYWGEGPYLDAVELNVINDPTAMANAIRGQVDVVLNLTPRDQIMFTGDPSVEVFEGAGGTFYPLGIDVNAAPFDNKALRQAIGYAIDRERIIDQVFDGAGETADVWWRTNEPGSTDEINNHYSYDPDRARELIAEAGAEGADVPMQVIGFGAVPAVYEIVQNNLRDVGLNPVGQVLETAAFDQGQTAGELGPVFMQIHGLQGFSAATLVDALPALRPNNPSKFDPPEYRQLKDALQAAQDEEAYAAALGELAEFMLDEAFSHVLVKTTPLHLKTPQVHGLEFYNVGYLQLGQAWLG